MALEASVAYVGECDTLIAFQDRRTFSLVVICEKLVVYGGVELVAFRALDISTSTLLLLASTSYMVGVLKSNRRRGHKLAGKLIGRQI